MSRTFAESALRREIAGAGSAAPESSGRPGDAGSSFLGGLRELAAALGSALVRGFELLLDWQERSRQRHILMGLDDHMLRDIGLSRSEAEAEYRKAPWQL